MARLLKLPNAGSTLTACGVVPSSCNLAVWLGITTPISSSGSVMWYKGACATAGCELLPIIASPAQTIIYGPFIFSDGISCGSITGGSALLYTG